MSKRRVTGGYGIYLIPGILLFGAVIVIPFLANIATSFTRWNGVSRPEWAGLLNYRRLLEDDVFWLSFANLAAMIIAMALVPTAIGLFLAALLFDYIGPRFGNRSASWFRSLFYIPQVLPIAVAGIVWGWILNSGDGALNSFLRRIGLGGMTENWLGDPSLALYTVMFVMIWFQLGYPVVIFMAGLTRVDPELHEAAELDGANWYQRFSRVIIHQIRPEIYVVILTSTIYALKVFGPIYVLTRGGPANATNVPSYFAYQNFFQLSDPSYGATISTVLSIFVVSFGAIFLALQLRRERTADAW